jgi:methylated-DNA-[protein]-cysteine S-methyltransferase
MKKLFVHKFKTPIGWIRVASTNKGLALVSLGKDGKAQFDSAVEKDFSDYHVLAGGNLNKRAEKQIGSYLTGRLKKFTLPLDLRGTPFQVKALRRVASIPYGQVRTYGRIASGIGKPRASRAVGGANATNPLPLVIPCHRVVASGGLGGYGGGLALKKRLLELEGIDIHAVKEK